VTLMMQHFRVVNLRLGLSLYCEEAKGGHTAQTSSGHCP
jgi:hypothetical protein